MRDLSTPTRDPNTLYVEALYELAESRLDTALRLSRIRRLLHRALPFIIDPDAAADTAAMIEELNTQLSASDAGEPLTGPLAEGGATA
ncbi:MAG: hypothetical protein ACU0DK_11650 [Pseudooceanicola sp.]